MFGFYIVLIGFILIVTILRSGMSSINKIFWLVALTGILLWCEKPDWLVSLMIMARMGIKTLF